MRSRVAHLHRPAAGRGIEEVVVHADDAGNDGRSGHIHHTRAGRDLHRRRGTHCRDYAGANHDRLIGLRRRARAIHEQDMRQRNQGGVDRDVLTHAGRE